MKATVALWYIRCVSAALVLQALLGGAMKLAEGRSDDLVHNGLHLMSGALGLALWSPTRARRFGRGFGLFYLLLGAVGWVWPNPLGVLPLGPADHIFHLTVGATTLGAGLLGRPGKEVAA